MNFNNNGSVANNNKLSISENDITSLIVLTLEISEPAFTYITVAGSIPIWLI